MFRPPVNRAMRVLDRAFFKKTVPLSAARVLDNKNISKCRTELTNSHDLLTVERLSTVRSDPDQERARRGMRCLLLRPDAQQWSAKVNQLVEEKVIDVVPFELGLDYNFWTYRGSKAPFGRALLTGKTTLPLP